MPETIYDQLIEVTKRTQKAGESYEDFAKDSVKRVGKLTDAKWNELSDELQTWVNESMKAFEAKSEPPALEGIPEQEETPSEGEEAEAEAEAGEEAPEEQAEEAEETDVESEKVKGAKKPKVVAKKASKAAAKPAKAAKVPKAAKAKTAGKKTAGAGKGRPSSFPAGGKIKILAKTNPHREGSFRDKNFKVLKAGMTVEQAVEAGCSKQQLWSMMVREVISII